MKNQPIYFFLVFLVLAGCQSTPSSVQSPDFERELQEKFIRAKDGDIIDLPEGTFTLTRSLIIDQASHITIRGKGKDKTILSFKGQKDGAEGIRVTANGIRFEDFAIMDAKGDNIKVQDATDVVFKSIKSGWSAVHSTENGAYGLYPVGCTNVLIEDCEVFGSSDAGVYVGQSKNIIVRRNYVHDNVAGIEIENSSDADVYENVSENNTGGVLVFDMPDLPAKNGARCRIYNNKIINNNVVNFGVKGTTVSEIPAGTGIIVMATNDCEIFNNDIKGNNSIGCAVVSWIALQRPYKDSLYDPYSGGIHIHDNRIQRGTGKLDASVQFGKLFYAIFGEIVPDIVFDGFINPTYRNPDGTVKEQHRICARNNGNVTFANLDLPNGTKTINRDLKSVDCSLPQLFTVKLNL